MTTPPKPACVIVESPYAGNIDFNVEYARLALKDSLLRGEAPIASHLLYTQVLDDGVPEQRQMGIAAGLEWRAKAQYAIFYVDLGWSQGMIHAKALYDLEGIPWIQRKLFPLRTALRTTS